MPVPVASPVKVSTGSGLLRMSAHSTFASSVPLVPLNTLFVLVAVGMNVNLPELSSNPKKPVFAVPSNQRNSTPLSKLSSAASGVAPPSVIIGSLVLTLALLITTALSTVSVPSICTLPVMSTFLVTSKSLFITVSPVAPSTENLIAGVESAL